MVITLILNKMSVISGVKGYKQRKNSYSCECEVIYSLMNTFGYCGIEYITCDTHKNYITDIPKCNIEYKKKLEIDNDERITNGISDVMGLRCHGCGCGFTDAKNIDRHINSVKHMTGIINRIEKKLPKYATIIFE